jgi:hypothetical protein
MGFMYGYHRVYQHEIIAAQKARESHDLCHNTPTEIAWVAYKDGEARCFLENKEYPHRVKGAYIDVDLPD